MQSGGYGRCCAANASIAFLQPAGDGILPAMRTTALLSAAFSSAGRATRRKSHLAADRGPAKSTLARSKTGDLRMRAGESHTFQKCIERHPDVLLSMRRNQETGRN
ncbi:hypothetical protein EB810_10210 [Altererythrobacter sp. FM1]|nr:hypothetical protein EB810_10210 [Altererythrobacter sp. FM1]